VLTAHLVHRGGCTDRAATLEADAEALLALMEQELPTAADEVALLSAALCAAARGGHVELGELLLDLGTYVALDSCASQSLIRSPWVPEYTRRS
jgi:hypothetical protein